MATPPTPMDIAALAMMIRGETFIPGSLGYEAQLQRMHNASFHSRKPAFFVLCHDLADIQEVLKFVNKFELPVSVRSGGHSACGSSCRDGTVVMDLSKMCNVEYDPTTENVTFQPGATLADINVHLLRQGRQTPVGVAPPTGSGGLVMHGGIGWLKHKYGLSVDNVTEVTIVLADGTVKILNYDSQGEDKELFFGVRGAAGVLGIVTSITMKTYPMEMLTGGLWMMIDDEHYTGTLALMKKARDMVKDQEINGGAAMTGGICMTNVPPDPLIPEEYHNKPATMCVICAWGDDDAAMEKAKAFIDREIVFGQPPGVMPFNVFNQIMAGMFLTFPPFGNYYKGPLVDSDTLSDEILDKYADKWAAHEPYLNPSLVGLDFHLGKAGKEHGAKLTKGNDHCCSKLRKYDFAAPILLYFPNEEGLSSKAKEMAQALDSIFDSAKVSAYCNYTSELGNEVGRETDLSFSDTGRLKAIKQRVDPKNLFHRSVIVAEQ